MVKVNFTYCFYNMDPRKFKITYVVHFFLLNSLRGWNNAL